MSIGWNFPGNGSGQIRGYSDAGIETFGGNELQALAREICQNSLDALHINEKEVQLEFQRYTIDTAEIPGHCDYVEVLNKCQLYWEKANSHKTNIYLKRALEAINEKKTFVLRVSDYKTTGLNGPYDEHCFDGWNALTKIDGGATKNGDKAGSFGIGKNAPFANSHFRLVFYRTLNDSDQEAAQGISRLLSFPNNLTDIMKTMTTGVGYYGNKNDNKPLSSITALDKFTKRTEKGTDVFIYGFTGSGNEWIDELIVEILNNFMMSIYSEKLCVKIQERKINSISLSDYMEKYKVKLKNDYCYYLTLSRSDDIKEYTLNFHDLGTLKLRVLVDPNIKLNRKVLITRTSGMKLFALGNISRMISFSGILEMQGEKLNEYFREMETPSHDKWLPSRHQNPEQAKIYYEELKDWVREIVLSLGEHSCTEEMEVEGLSGVLKDEHSKVLKGDDNSKKETLNNNLGNILISSRTTYQENSKGLFFGNDTKDATKKDKVPGMIIEYGQHSATRKLNGEKRRKKIASHHGVPSSDGNNIVHKSNGNKNCPLKNVRIIKLSNNRYRVNFEIPHTINDGHIEIVTVGENGKSNRLMIGEAYGQGACTNIKAQNQRIDFSSIFGNEKVTVEFSLVDNREYAMEVNVYEHN